MSNNSFLSQTATTVVFIDFSVSKYHTLQTGIVEGVETVILSPERDGIEEITQVLQQNPQVNSVYIVAQGSPGSWYLGNTHLSLDNLDKLQDYQSLITTEKIKQILLDNNNGGFESIFDRGNGIAFADLQGAQSNNYQGFTQTSFPIPQEATLSQAQIPLTQQNLANLFATTNGSLTKLSSDLATLFTGIGLNPPSLQSTTGINPSSLQSTTGLIADQSFLQITGDNVAIEATADTNPDQLLTDLQSLGLQQSLAFGRVVSGVIPISELGNVAALSSLRLVRPVYRPITNVGLVTSQGDVAQRSSNARSIYPGVDGTGITVGVLSDSYDNLRGASADVASGDLPSGVIVLQDLASGGTDEGRAMLQIVSDVAPGAKLAFHTANGGQAAFANGIKNLAKPVANGGAGASVIVDDVFYFAEPYFQDGIVTQAVDQVAADGVVYFSSAGNQARQSYESAFVPGSSATVGGQNYTFQDFDPSGVVNNFQAITINGAFRPGLQWDEPFASASTTGVGSQNDLDLFLFASPDFTSNIYTSSTSNNLNADPFEMAGVNGTGTVYLAIGKRDSVGGPDPTKIKYVDFGSSNNTYQFATNSSTSFGHNQSANGLGVAAAYYQQTPAFGTNPAVAESFTSLGGTPILFDTAGNRLATPIIRNQPAITAPDGVDTTFFGQDLDGNGKPNFFGTSAAAPSAAGVAALIRQAAPSATNTQVYNALKNTAIDMNTPGYDLLTGYGLIQADAAIATLNYAPTNLTLSNNTIAENQAIGTGIGTFTSTDPDTGNTFTYSLVTGTGSTDNALFAITGNQLQSNGIFDYETKNSYSVRVKTTDQGGLSYEKQLTIGVNDLDEITGNPLINNGRTPIVGTAGSDYIIGGPGAKTITGGAGNDFFVFTDLRDVGQRITDFTVGTDKIVLTQLMGSINYIGIDPIADQYMRFVAGTGSNTGSTFLQIDRDGILGSATFKNFLQVDNITTTQLNNLNNFVF